jgi:hypothetical protein
MDRFTNTRLPGVVADVCLVERAPTWRREPLTLSYVFLNVEPSGQELVDVYRWASEEGLANPRVISPFTLGWSAVFNPRFHRAVSRYPLTRLRVDDTADVVLPTGSRLNTAGSLTRFWLESVVFLAGVTLSAAIVQSRWSAGTLASKYDRLWQVGRLAQLGELPGIAADQLLDQVLDLVDDSAITDLERLLTIRRLFEAVVSRLGTEVSAEPALLHPKPMASTLAARFGFVDGLKDVLGSALRCVVVYGSSVSSEDFADYDLVVVSDRPEDCLRSLAGTSPTWRGKELNMSVYSPRELWDMQRLSGDNLADYGVCLYGEVEVPCKPVAELLIRNLSFGVVRQRQQLGMIGPALSDEAREPGDDRRNLYEYFVKIPANVAKGTFGAARHRLPKEVVHEWLRLNCGFDTTRMQELARTGNAAAALADSAVATASVLRVLNDQFDVVQIRNSSPLSLVGEDGQ